MRPGDINPYAAPESPVDLAPGRPLDVGGFRSLTPVAQAITVVMGLIVLFRILDDINLFVTISVMHRVVAGADYEQSELVSIDQRARITNLAVSGLHLAGAVMFCVFMPRGNRNARAFGVLPMTFTPGWTAGVFFVPIWNLYKPYQAIKEIWQGSDPDSHAPTFLAPLPRIFPWWWGLYLVDRIVYQIFGTAFKNTKGGDEFIVRSWVALVISGLSIGVAILAAMVVRAVASRQDQRQRNLPAGTPPPSPSPSIGPPLTAGAGP